MSAGGDDLCSMSKGAFLHFLHEATSGLVSITENCLKDIETYLDNNPDASSSDLGHAVNFVYCIPKLTENFNGFIENLVNHSGLSNDEISNMIRSEIIPDSSPLVCVRNEISTYYPKLLSTLAVWQDKIDSVS